MSNNKMQIRKKKINNVLELWLNGVNHLGNVTKLNGVWGFTAETTARRWLDEQDLHFIGIVLRKLNNG